MKRLFASLCLLSLLTTPLIAAPDFHVDVNSAGAADGTSWGNACTFTYALANASDGNEIWLAEGVYTNGGTTSFTVSDDLTIYGGFTNGATTLAERDTSATHLDGEGTRRVMIVNDNLILDGVTVTNGRAQVASGTSGGSGIYKSGFYTFEIRNCAIVDCKMTLNFWGPDGAALYLASGASTLITNTLIARNGDACTGYCGGGREGQAIYCSQEPLTMRNCTIRENYPVNPFASRGNEGGAIHMEGTSGSLLIEDCDFIDNRTADINATTRDGGGAICIQGPDGAIRRCLFKANKASFENANYDPSGGAIEVESSSSEVLIEECIFEDNLAGIRTGGTTIKESYGGAFFMDAGKVTISNCTFVGNHSRYDGGAIAMTGGELDVVNCILYTNSSGSRGSDITLLGGTMNVINTRIGGSSSPTFIYDEGAGVTLSNTFTNDPLFADSDNGDYHLQSKTGRYDPGTMTFVTTDGFPHSPCIDAGTTATGVGAEPTPNGSRINLGRYGGTAQASKSPAAAPDVVNRDNTVNVNLATVRGELVNNDTIAECTLYYSTTDPPTFSDASSGLFPPQQTGTVFSVQLSGLLYATTYYYTWFATNDTDGDFESATSNFTTGAQGPGGGSDIIHVDADAAGSENGLDWFSAFTSVADAMAAVNANTNEVWVADGTYNDAEITVSTACSIYGGFDASETTRSARDVSSNEVRLDGDSIRRVMTVSADCTLDGLVITNGVATGGGCGIKKDGAYTLTINDCTITDNRFSTLSTSPDGAGLFLQGGTTIITNSIIEGNGDDCTGYCGGGREGQGIFCNNEALTIRDCTIRGNAPKNAFASRGNEGGGIHAQGTSGVLLIEDCTFIDNETPVISSSTRDGGGAICIQGPDAVIRRCLFEHNIAGKSQYNYDSSGGAIEVESSSSEVLIEYCLFEYNETGLRNGITTTPEQYGGALFVDSGNVTVSNCNFVGNHSSIYGGAVGITGGTLDITHCIFHTNNISVDDGISGSIIAAIGGTLNVMYSVLDGTTEPTYIFDQGSFVNLMNVSVGDPLFNDSDGRDYHLRSSAGRYDTNTMTFVTTDGPPFSPAIDLGDASVGVGAEPTPNGNRVNAGYHGGTDQASKSPTLAPDVENGSNTVNVNSAVVYGELVNNDTIAEVTLFYSTSSPPTLSDPSASVSTPQQTGTVFSVSLSSLLFSTTYYYSWYATNNYGVEFEASYSNFVTGAAPPTGGPLIIHVKEDAVGAGDGSSWFSAYTSLNDAMAAINNPNTNEIWVATGQYDDATVVITETCKIFGGFAGTETNRSQRSVATNGRPGIDGDNLRRGISITGGTVLLNGLAITNGATASGEVHGIGIKVNGASIDLSINDCHILENHYVDAGNNGSVCGFGMYINLADVAITNTLFADNGHEQATYRGNHLGQGIYLTGSGSSLDLQSCIFSNNSGTDFGTRNSEGGALWASAGTIDARDCEFTDNSIGTSNGTTDGGGIGKFYAGTYKFLNCLFRGNKTAFFSGNLGYGGGMILHNASANVILENCTITDSTCRDRGAAFYVLSGNLMITNCILWTNQVSFQTTHASTEGNDIANVGGNVNVSYTSFSGDETDDTYVYDAATVTLGSGIIVGDPLFANEFGDLHVKSEAGRFDPATQTFVTTDTENSPALDGGKPGGLSTYTNEVQPNGGQVNMGAYGNTAEASKTPASAAPIVTNRTPTVTNNYATMKGELITIDTTADIYIFVGTSDQGESQTGWSEGFVQPSPIAQSTGTVFEASLGGLAYNTTYFFRCYATNAAGDHFAQNPISFTTQSEPPGGPDGVIHVKAGAAGAQNGETWFDAVATLAAGVALVDGPTNEIWTATPHELVLLDIVIATNLSIYGGFIGDEVSGETLRSQRSTANVTALDGNITTRLIDITDGTVVLDSLVITNGLEASGQVGHGVRASGHDALTIASCVISDNGNNDGRDGGGLYVSGGTAYICDSTFARNGGGHGIEGGAIYGTGSASLTMANVTFTNNHDGTTAGRQSKGGAIYLSSATLNATNCTFVGNKVGDSASEPHGGGAIYADTGSEAYFKNCVFYDNGNDSGTPGGGPNGGVFHLNGTAPYPTVTVENCTIAFNIADASRYGGMTYVACGYFIAINSIMEQNEADTSFASIGDEIYATGTASYVELSFSNITGTNGNYVVNGGDAYIIFNSGVITSNPLFNTSSDFHLKSIGGRWDPGTSTFVFDAVTSPCVDAGDPSSDFSQEISPNGGRVNMGAYGNTAEASKTFLSKVTIIMFE